MPDEPEVIVSYKHLIRLEDKGTNTFMPDGSENEYNVKELLGTVYVENKTEDEILQLLKKIVDKSDTEESLKEKARKNRLIMKELNFYGIGVDLDELYNRVIKWKRNSKKI